MGSIKQFRLPDAGEGLTRPRSSPGGCGRATRSKVNDILVEIETAKSLVELPSPFAGVVTELLVAEGETVDGRHPDHRGRHRSGRDAAPPRRRSRAVDRRRRPSSRG